MHVSFDMGKVWWKQAGVEVARQLTKQLHDIAPDSISEAYCVAHHGQLLLPLRTRQILNRPYSMCQAQTHPLPMVTMTGSCCVSSAYQLSKHLNELTPDPTAKAAIVEHHVKGRLTSSASILTRSSRTIQHRQPLFSIRVRCCCL